MDGYIERKVLFEKLSEREESERESKYPLPTCSLAFTNYLAESSERRVFKDMISQIPTYDVAPIIHGQWNDNGYGLCICSVCGYPPSYVPAHCFASSFCPKCGAKMDVKE